MSHEKDPVIIFPDLNIIHIKNQVISEEVLFHSKHRFVIAVLHRPHCRAHRQSRPVGIHHLLTYP